jgi:hypothetical protein
MQLGHSPEGQRRAVQHVVHACGLNEGGCTGTGRPAAHRFHTFVSALHDAGSVSDSLLLERYLRRRPCAPCHAAHCDSDACGSRHEAGCKHSKACMVGAAMSESSALYSAQCVPACGLRRGRLLTVPLD